MIDHQVFESLCEERSYATQTYGSKPRSVGEHLLLIDKYWKDAKHAWQHHAGDDRALHELRKVGAMVLAALEEHGCPRRGTPFHNGEGQDELPVIRTETPPVTSEPRSATMLCSNGSKRS